MSRPTQVKIQIYDPSTTELCIWQYRRMDPQAGLDAIDSLTRAGVIRLFVGGLGFGYLPPWWPGSEEGLKEVSWYEFCGDDEYVLWEDVDYLYIASLNPKGDDRLTRIESFPKSGRLEGKASRVRISREQWELMSASLDLKPPFVGVQVPDDHARQLGLMA